jgi:gamma-glutamyltranspeptidase/glutathione hydrolase
MGHTSTGSRASPSRKARASASGPANSGRAIHWVLLDRRGKHNGSSAAARGGLDRASKIELSIAQGSLVIRDAKQRTQSDCASRGRVLLCLVLSSIACGRDSSATPSFARAPLGLPVPTEAEPVVLEPGGIDMRAVSPGMADLVRVPPPLTPGGSDTAESVNGMVVSVEEQATRAGVSVLEAGGNAVDAAVATAYALAVTHPSAGNLGGGGFMLVARPGEPTAALDFRERAPLATEPGRFKAMQQAGAQGPAASAVPGSVAGLNLAQRSFGRLGLDRVMAPAIALARNGHRVGSREALTLLWAWPSLKRDPEARRIFGSAQGPLRAGELLVQPELALTLERIARAGDAGFYAGPTADALVRAMGSSGSITEADLLEYRAVIREPLELEYRGYAVTTMPPPSSGGLALAQMLLALESLAAYELPAGSADELHLFAEVSKRAQAQRRFELVDPDSAPQAMSAAGLASRLTAFSLLDVWPRVDPAHATPSRLVNAAYQTAERELEHTTHLSVVDADGNAVSCTTTLSGGFGARYVAAGTGVVMNNSLAAFSNVGLNLPRGGRRMLSSMAPTLLSTGGRVVALLGSPGGDTIPSTIVQVLRHLVDHGMTLEEAIEAPRLHHGFVPDELRLEHTRPFPDAVLLELQARGHTLRADQVPMGDANNIIVVAGVAYGHADTREGGLALPARRGR